MFYVVRRFTDGLDMNSLYGLKCLETSWSTRSPSFVTESATSPTGERSVVVLTMIASLSILKPL